MNVPVVILFFVSVVLADPSAMPISVFGNGATQSQNSSGYRLHATVGQPLAKRVVNDGSTLRGGFWPTMRATLFAPVGDSPSQSPNEFAFVPVYPNPFNPSATLSFSLPQSSEVRLSLFDVTGRKVVTLAEGRYAAGSHRLTWSADNLPSGTYFARLQAGRYTKTQKLYLLK